MKIRKKALITGVCGQDGAYLAELLLKNDYDVYGGAKRSSQDQFSRLELLGVKDQIRLLNFDLTEPNSITEFISAHQFDEIYNLGAQSFVGVSWEQPFQTTQVNAMGALHLLDSIKRFSPHSKFYQASTSEMFGLVQEVPQSEKTPLYPRSPYGVAKVYAHFLTMNYRESYDLFASTGILFNHESPLRGAEFVTKKIARGLAQIYKGLTEDSLKLGNLEAERDWGYAADYVDAMWRILNHEHADDFVIATGRKTTVRKFVERCWEFLGSELEWEGEGAAEKGRDVSTGKLIVEVDPQFFRPAEVDLLIGDPTKARDQLGWAAKTDLEALVEIMMNFEMTGGL